MPPTVDIQQLLRARQAAGLELTADQMRMLEEVLPPQQQGLVRAQAGAGQVLGDPSGGTAPAAGPGMRFPGNVDMSTRPSVQAPEGGMASVRSISIGTPRGEVLIPTVSDDGRILADEEAIQLYRQTGRHLGIYGTPDEATAAGDQIHRNEEARMGQPLSARRIQSLYSQPVPSQQQIFLDQASPPVADNWLDRLLNRRPEGGDEGAIFGAPQPSMPDVTRGAVVRQFVDEEPAPTAPPAAPMSPTPAETGPVPQESSVAALEAEAARQQAEADAARGALEQIPGEAAGDMNLLDPGAPEPADPNSLSRIRNRDPVTGTIGNLPPQQGGTVGDATVLSVPRAPAPTGTLGNRYDVRLGMEEQLRNPLSAATAQELADARAATQMAQQQHDLGARAVAMGQAAGLGEFGARQQAEAEAAQQRAQEHARQLNEALGQFSEAAQRVANREVDPNQVFGGAGGRMGAAIAVALGELGRALTGEGENQALNIINQQIERSMAAQQMNIQNAQRGVANQGQALGMMNSIFQSEEAATNAARALYLQGYAAQIDALSAGLQGQQLVNAQQLRAAVQREMEVAARAAAETEGPTIEARVRVQGRGAGTYDEARNALLSRSGQAPTPTPQQAPGGPQRGSQRRQRPPSQPGQEQQGQADETSVLTQEGTIAAQVPGLEEPVVVPGNLTPEQQVEFIRQAMYRSVAGGLTMRTGQNPSFTPALAARLIREGGLSGVEGAEDLLSEADDLSFLPPGVVPDRGAEGRPRPGWFAAYRRAISEEGGRERLGNAVATATLLDGSIDAILGSQDFDVEITNREEAVQRARTYAGLIRAEVIRAASGAQVPEEEYQRYLDLLPDPNDISVANVTGLWDRTTQAWGAFSNFMMDRANRFLGNAGLAMNTRLLPRSAAAVAMLRRFGSDKIRIRRGED